MSLIVKVMSGHDLADEDSRKPYFLMTGATSVHFYNEPDQDPVLVVDCGDGPERFILGGNVYVMNENGKTISSFCPSMPMSRSG